MSSASRFNLAVRPSVLKDGTFGVYAIPDDNSNLEYQLDGCFSTSEQARALAEAYLRCGGNRFVPDSIEISEVREIELPPLVEIQTEEGQAQALKANLKKLLAELPNSLSLKPLVTILLRITEVTPYLLALIAAIVFKFSLSVTVPKDLPIIGELIVGSTLRSPGVAHLLPFLLLASTIILQFRARASGFVNSAMRDNILGLALAHGWRRERFLRLLLEVVEVEGWGSLWKFGEWMARWDPNTLRQVAKDAVQSSDPAVQEEVKEELPRLIEEDFEARIHALYFMDRQPSFSPSRMAVHPLLFVSTQRRAVRRGRFLATSPLIWAFALSPWPGAFGWLGMSLLVLATIAPIIVWNYGLFVRNRGIPCGMAWIDINSDMRLIRAL